MPLPTLSSVHINSPLNNLSVAYAQDQANFKASKMSPLVPVNKATNSYFIWDKGSWARDGMQVRAPGTGFARAGYSVSNTSYTCIEYALEHVMPDPVRDNYDGPLNADMAAITFLNQQGLIRRERKFASSFLAASVWARDVTGHGSTVSDTSHVFWDNASADIIGTLKKQIRYVESQTGRRPNRFITSQAVVDVMLDDDAIVDRFKHTQAGAVSVDGLAAVCGLGTKEKPGEIVVLNAVYNSANEGATAVMDYMIGDVGLLEYVADSPQINEPSATYTFSWSPHDGFSNGALAVFKYRDEPHESDIYRAKMHFDMKITASDCGVYFSNLLT